MYNFTPLHTAALEGHPGIVSMLLKDPDVDVNTCGEVGILVKQHARCMPYIMHRCGQSSHH